LFNIKAGDYYLIDDAVVLGVVGTWFVVEELAEFRGFPVVDGLTARRTSVIAR